MAKMEMYASKAAMKKHEKAEPKSVKIAEKKAGVKNVVKKSGMKKMGKKK